VPSGFGVEEAADDAPLSSYLQQYIACLKRMQQREEQLLKQQEEWCDEYVPEMSHLHKILQVRPAPPGQPLAKGVYAPEICGTLVSWFHDHIANPYPNDQARRDLAASTGLSELQIKNWFINRRKRHLSTDPQHPTIPEVSDQLSESQYVHHTSDNPMTASMMHTTPTKAEAMMPVVMPLDMPMEMSVDMPIAMPMGFVHV